MVTGQTGASVNVGAIQRAVRWNRSRWRATAAAEHRSKLSHWISILLSHIVVQPGETEREGGRRREKSVLDLIFHTPASYKQLSYTTLALNNQSGKGSQNDEIPCHLLPDLFSGVTRRESEEQDGGRGCREAGGGV